MKISLPLRQGLAALVLGLVAIRAVAAPALQPDLSSLGAVPQVAPAAGVVARGLASPATKNPLRFAVATDLPVALAGGLWDRAPDDRERWRLRVSSPGAVALGLEFSRFVLPASAGLWVYDAAATQLQGPYTAADVGPEGRLWTALVPGSEAVIELRVAAADKDAVELRLARVSHAYRPITRGDADPAVTAKSGSCNIDVACSDGNDWRPEIRSVARLTIGNELLCTGQLMNTPRNDGDPLLLTANHCEIGQSYPASSVIAYWNFQTSTCGGTPDGSLAQRTSGATLLAGDVSTDFTLLRLRSRPASAYDVHYAGWDASGSAPQSGVAIHHPSGDEKRISTYTTAASATNTCIDGTALACARLVKAWRVNWTRGTTEQGSSGGGLWDQNHRLVGLLSGGLASCADPNESDFFARFAEAYQANASASGQLKVWLDPDNTGVTRVNGLDARDAGAVVIANDDSYAVNPNSAATSFAVLANDSSTSGSLSLVSVGTPDHGGSASLSGNSVSYRPASGYTGTESFTYTITNGTANSSATVTVTVAAGSGTGGDSSSGGGAIDPPTLLALLGAVLLAARRTTGRTTRRSPEA